MQFCPQCNFMVYTKLTKNPDNINEVSLTNYCKNCSWTGVLENTDSAIYKRNYENDFIADRILNNKYTIYDNALPRLTIGCVNKKCLTNVSLNPDKTFIINNLPETTEEEDIEKLLNSDKQQGKINDYIRLRLTSLAVKVPNLETRDELIEKYNLMDYDTNILSTEIYSKPDNEVLYIKYDPENMKYLYMCVNCGSSWQGNY